MFMNLPLVNLIFLFLYFLVFLSFLLLFFLFLVFDLDLDLCFLCDLFLVLLPPLTWKGSPSLGSKLSGSDNIVTRAVAASASDDSPLTP